MLKFGNKEFRNLQEQVLKNMQNIANIKEGTAVLSEFGIKVVGEVNTLADLPSVADYKAAHEDWDYGDAFAVGTEAPYTLYILTRENDTITADHWFDIGDFPAPGPQGATGPQGEVGPQGPQGNTGEPGDDAGFGSVLATAQTLPAGSSATATVTTSGPNTAKEFSFTFGIPRGSDGSNPVWGNIQGTLSDQTDLKNALDAKQDELVSGTNIKTINSQSIVGSGNIEINSGVWGNITGTLSDQTDLANALAEKQPVIDASHKLSASYVSGLATVATTGAYADLEGKPTIGTGTITIKKNGDTIDSFGLNQTADQNINISVPTKTSDLSNDSNFTSKTYVDDGLALKQDVISDLSDIRAGAALGDTAVQPADLATVATSGSYNDLSNKPTIPDVSNMVTTDTAQTISGAKQFSGGFGVTTGQNKAINIYSSGTNSIIGFSEQSTDSTIELTANPASGTHKEVLIPDNSGTLALTSDIPTTMSWSQITNKPTIGDATLTIQKNGTTVDTFTANATSNKTINITVPTNSDYVDKTSAQTITGNKTFTGTINAKVVDFEVGNTIYTSNTESTDHYNLTLDVKDTDDSDPHYIKLQDGWYERHSGDIYDCLQSTYIRQPKYAEWNDNDHLFLELPRGSADSSNPKVIATTDQIPSNYVTTNTTQTISGAKTFTALTTFGNTSSDAAVAVAGGTGALGIILTEDKTDTPSTLLTIETPTDENIISLPDASGTIALTDDIPPIDNKTIIRTGGNELCTAVGGWKEESAPISLNFINQQQTWGLYNNRYYEYYVSVADRTITAEQVATDQQALYDALTTAGYSQGSINVPIILMFSEDGINWDEYDATGDINTMNTNAQVYINHIACQDLSITSAQARIQIQYGMEFFSNNNNQIDSYEYFKLKFVFSAPASVTYHTIDNNYISSDIARVSQIPSVPVQDVTVNGISVVSSGIAAIPVPVPDEKTIISTYGVTTELKTAAGGWVEEGEGPDPSVVITSSVLDYDSEDQFYTAEDDQTFVDLDALGLSQGDVVYITVESSSDGTTFTQFVQEIASLETDIAEDGYYYFISENMDIEINDANVYCTYHWGQISSDIYVKVKIQLVTTTSVYHAIDSNFIGSDIARSADVVTLNGNQTISGVKRFTGGQLIAEDPNSNSQVFTMLNTTTNAGFDVGLVLTDNVGSGFANLKLASGGNTQYNIELPTNSGTVALTSDISTAIGNLAYKNGDTFTVRANYLANGSITASAKQIMLQIVVPKSLANISSVTVDKCEGIFRGVAGYVNGTTAIDYADNADYTIRADIATDNVITLNIYRSSAAFTDATNNTTINALFTANNLEFTFNE